MLTSKQQKEQGHHCDKGLAGYKRFHGWGHIHNLYNHATCLDGGGAPRRIFF